MAYLVDNPPRIRQYRRPRRATPSGVVVVHTAESYPDEKGPDTGAENVAAFIRDRANYGSYHDLADSDSIVELVPYDAEAYHDGTGSNPHSYGVSAATQAHRWDDLGSDWVDAAVRNMARASARYARWIKREHGVTIPARRISRTQSDQRKPGFISHGQRDPGRRTDPGEDFPWGDFLNYYAAEMSGDDDMPLSDADVEKVADRVIQKLTYWEPPGTPQTERQLGDPDTRGSTFPALVNYAAQDGIINSQTTKRLADVVYDNTLGMSYKSFTDRQPVQVSAVLYRTLALVERLAELSLTRQELDTLRAQTTTPDAGE